MSKEDESMPAFRPITGRFGAEVEGVDARAPLDGATAEALRDGLAVHGVLVLRGQHLDAAALKRFAGAFGPLLRLPYVEAAEGEPELIRVKKEATEAGGVFGGDWHADFSFLEAPPAGSVLAALEVPPVGGDTLWCSMAAAWDALPEALKGLLLGRDAIHVGKPYGVRWAPPPETRAGASMRMTRGDPSADAERRHPAVLRCPRTGKLSLFLNPLYVTRLDGLSEAESRPLLDQIQAHCLRPEFQMRLRWGPGDVAVWDNLATQHYAINDYQGARREMLRATFGGPAPRARAA
jgi:taurine dioxygenase